MFTDIRDKKKKQFHYERSKTESLKWVSRHKTLKLTFDVCKLKRR